MINQHADFTRLLDREEQGILTRTGYTHFILTPSFKIDSGWYYEEDAAFRLREIVECLDRQQGEALPLYIIVEGSEAAGALLINHRITLSSELAMAALCYDLELEPEE